MSCNTCGTTITSYTSTCPAPTCCVPVAPVVPACRANYKDACRIKPCVKCVQVCPKPCPVKKVKCKLPSWKQSCRTKPCPVVEPCCAGECGTCTN